MSDREIIHDYLKSLSKYLSRLDKAEADEVVREIESHIYDAIDGVRDDSLGEFGRDSGDGQAVDLILSGFGDPRELAAAYVNHILDGAPPPAGFKAIQIVKQSVTRGLFYSMAVGGYGLTIFLLLLAGFKLIAPNTVKIWEADQGNSWIIGLDAQMPAGSIELFGFWVLPVSLMLGLGSGYLTYRILKILKEKM